MAKTCPDESYEVANAEASLRRWVQENARRWGPDDVDAFDFRMLQLREAANREGVALVRAPQPETPSP